MKMNKTDVENAIKEIKKKKEPIFVKELELGEGEIYVGNLSDADKFQVLIRHINLLEGYIKQQAFLSSTAVICLQELCKKNKIDIESILNQGK